ncbi:MAG TPA: class I SAM-dependent methyltransferase [Acidimicrobiales bacterium]|nr:class I SAM-dependent methyltransferase [Acidimicrobiales bacterium]
MDRDAWDARYAAAELVWTAEPNRFVVAELAGTEPGRALDLGCGEGRNAIWLASKGWTATGVDFSGAGLAKAHALAAGREVDVAWVQADLTRYEPPAGHFDLVLLAYLHLPAPQMAAVLASAAGALAPGGVLVVIGHDTTNIAEGHGGPQDPSVLYGPEDVAGALGALVVDKAERVRRPVETDAGLVHAVDVLVRAHRAAAGQSPRRTAAPPAQE